MNKPNSNFKMKKQFKVLLSSFGMNKEQRNSFKKLLIQAQLAEENSERVVFK